MTYNGFNYEWDENLSDGMGGWRITEHDETVRGADDFLAALKKKLS